MKIRLKITLSVLCLLSLLFGVGGSALITISFNTAYEREKESAFDSYEMVLNTLELVSQISRTSSNSDLSITLEQLQNQGISGMQALRLSSSEKTLYESNTLAGALNNISKTPKPGSCLFVEFEFEGSHYLQLSGVLLVEGTSLYLDAAYDISSVYTIRAEQQAAFYKVFAVLVVACFLLAYSVTWLLTRPLVQLSRASRELARGNLTYRARVDTNDEIGSLAHDFNIMADRIEKGFSSLENTLDAQERFMGSFAHELKTPMTSIIGYAELIRSQALTPEEQMDAAHFIFTEGKRLENLSFKLLEILTNEQDSVRMKRVSLDLLIDDVVNHLRPLYEKDGITLAHKAAGGGTCMMEPVLVRSLLMNLLDNARKAIDGVGAIHIESRVLPGACIIRVCDNGKGIPAASLTRLTEAFYRVDKSRAREQGGVGLGLTLCARIVEIHGGDMQFESSEGAGTCVTVTLRGERT